MPLSVAVPLPLSLEPRQQREVAVAEQEILGLRV